MSGDRPDRDTRTGRHPAPGVLRRITPWVAVLLADNPGPMTLEGTNTWVLRGPGAAGCVVVDPGEDDGAHLAAVARCGPVELTVLTHHHHDHAGGAARFAALTGAAVRAADPALCVGGPPVRDGETVTAAGVRLRVLATPGHTADSVSLELSVPGEDGPHAVLTGDSILGRGTTVLGPESDALGAYLTSLRALAALPADTLLLPGHGPESPDAAAAAARYLDHREQRLAQVRDALTVLGGDATAAQVVELVYADVDRAVWPAAEASVRAQLAYLRT